MNLKATINCKEVEKGKSLSQKVGRICIVKIRKIIIDGDDLKPVLSIVRRL